MASFRYKALSAAGARVTGTVEAPSQEAAVQQLRGRGYYPISADATVARPWRAWLAQDIRWRRAPSQRDLAIVTHELATLLHAGLPLDRALSVVVGLGETERLRRPLTTVLTRIRDGSGLADALAAEPAFPRLYVSTVRAGEMGGNLEAALHRLAEYLGKAHALREAVVSALIYPALLGATAVLSIGFILVFVLPQFEPLFENAGKSLPLSTQIVVDIGAFIGGCWWLILLLAVAAAAALWRALQRPAFRRRWDARILRLPLLGDLVTKIEMERFSRTLGILLSNGVTLPAALGITRETLSNRVIMDAVGDAATSLREGEALADRLARTKVFPALTLDLLRIGEEAGTLDEMLLRQADLHEQGVKRKIDRLLALLVPGLTVFLGCAVAGLIGSILIAILSVNELALQ